MGFNFYITSEHSAVFIALILEIMLCCIYTLLCGYTTWRLLLRKSRYPYIFCLIILWLLTISTISIDLYSWVPAGLRQNRIGVMLNIGDIFFSFSILNKINCILSTLAMMIADALLIYRCYNVCGRKKWILITLGTCLFANIVGALIVFNPFRKSEPKNRLSCSRPFRFTYFIFGYFLSSIFTTTVSTFLIVFRILSATQGNPSITNRTPYRRIQRIIIESGAIYLSGLVVTGIPLALISYIMGGSGRGRLAKLVYIPCTIILTYSQAILTPLSGIAPTLVALRVVTQKPETEADESPPVSRLTFRRTVRRTHTPPFGSLMSSLHFESTWGDEDLVTGTSFVADGDEAIVVQGSDGGERIRLQEA